MYISFLYTSEDLEVDDAIEEETDEEDYFNFFSEYYGYDDIE